MVEVVDVIELAQRGSSGTATYTFAVDCFILQLYRDISATASIVNFELNHVHEGNTYKPIDEQGHYSNEPTIKGLLKDVIGLRVLAGDTLTIYCASASDYGYAQAHVTTELW